MQTRVEPIDPILPEKKIIEEAGKLIRNGKLVAFPTETVYGLGANALSEDAVTKIFKAKGRPPKNPLIVHISKRNQLKGLVKKYPPIYDKLMDFFWPGPLTLVFEKTTKIPKNVTGGLNTVAIRMPKNRVALELINASRVPIAAPSANLSGKPSPTQADHVVKDLDGKIPLVLDGGMCDVGLESTVLDLTAKPPAILRPGKITLEQIRKVLPGAILDPGLKKKTGQILIPKSPGMMYKHYSPNAEIILVKPKKEGSQEQINAIITENQNKKVAVITTDKTEKYLTPYVKYIGKTKGDIAKYLFSAFRELDELGVDIILIESVTENGLGLAIMNRLNKAASKK